ncbi:MAG: hypothetical protein C0399_06955 [Syntrophus sp. (in: bacteria)]|nr:hypothetical protein [Syntrophus sp. (in: bacteria)]
MSLQGKREGVAPQAFAWGGGDASPCNGGALMSLQSERAGAAGAAPAYMGEALSEFTSKRGGLRRLLPGEGATRAPLMVVF